MKNKWDERSFVFIIAVAIEPIPRLVSVARRALILLRLEQDSSSPNPAREEEVSLAYQLPTVLLGSREKNLEFIEPAFPPPLSLLLFYPPSSSVLLHLF